MCVQTLLRIHHRLNPQLKADIDGINLCVAASSREYASTCLGTRHSSHVRPRVPFSRSCRDTDVILARIGFRF